jgi:DNA-binding NarL/FixJ family response regulator
LCVNENVGAVPASLRRRLEGRDPHAEFAIAQQSWAQARYDDVVDRLRATPEPRGRLLLARTYLRRHEHRLALDALRGVRFDDADEAATAAILRATASEPADPARGPRVPPEVPPGTNRKIRAAADYYAALSAWSRGEMDPAAKGAGRAVEAGDAEIRALGTELQAWVEVSRGRPGAALSKFVEALDILARDYKDEFVRASSLQGAAFIAVETFDFEILPRLAAEVSTLQPTTTIARACLSVRLNLASLHALQGDDALCYEALLGARAIVAAAPFSAVADIALGSFFRRRGSPDAAALHLDMAYKRLEGVDWSKADLEAHLVPVLFALEASPSGDPRAGRALTKALSHAGKRDPLLAFEHDNRAAAMALLARGRIEASRGNTQTASADIEKAIALWQACGDRHMTCIASLDLMRIGRTGMTPALTSLLRKVPRSWLKAEADRLVAASKSPFLQLSAAEQRVLEKICEGLTSRQIAKKLGRSPSTIRNQTISIFRKLDVSTRSGLVALAKKQDGPRAGAMGR